MSWNTTRHTGKITAITPTDVDEATAATGRCPSGTHSLWITTAGDVVFSTVLDIENYHTLAFTVGETPAIRFHHIQSTLTTATGIKAFSDPDL